MPRLQQSFILAAAVIGLLIAASARSAGPERADSCDRACLRDLVGVYLDALAAHDPGRLPVTADVRFTENGVAIPLGDALWVTVSSVGTYRHDYYDADSGQVAAHATFTENGAPGFMALRLKVVGRKIAEIETILARNSRGALTMPARDPLWDEGEPTAGRLTRAQLVDGVLGYMRAVAASDGKLAPFAESCIRLENGNVMSLGPHDTSPLPLAPLSRDDDWAAAVRTTFGLGCARQIDTRIYSFITGFDNARFPVVDTEHQIVFAIFNFRRRGTVKEVTMPNGRTYPMMPATQWPNENLLGEAWKFRGGKITRIEAVFFSNNVYKTGTGWP
jgi:hypothetical protein